MPATKNLSVAALLLAAPAASVAQSLINGQALEYGHAYRCQGERVIVSRCRDNSDASYCQTVYPDRPYVNGMQVAPVEMRGDVVAKLNACNQAASAPAVRNSSARQAAAARANAPSSVSSYAKTGKPPGIGKAAWWLMDYDEKSAIFYTKARIKRTGAHAEGWFTIVYPQPKDIPGTQIKAAQYNQTRYLADCVKGTDRLSEAAYLNEDGKILGGAYIEEAMAPFTASKAGSWRAEQFNILCGKPQRPINPEPMNSDGAGLVFLYHGLLQAEGK